MSTASREPASTSDERSASELAAVELRGIGVNYRLPIDRIGSFKEYVLKRFRGQVAFRDLWALRSVDLTVQPGEVFGIVGPNGAGKSTLLKVISRVLRPTTGRVIVRGKIAPMLELGAGFHPDLTGRENVFLNASILGYPKDLMKEHFDEIAEFSELGRFIDIPTRTYSSGMTARLGFSVATVFRPDVLILDEVLAVGDIGFQKKCLERIKEFRQKGTTILTVSHNPQSIAENCDRVAWLAGGEIQGVGSPDTILIEYQESQLPGANAPDRDVSSD